MQPVNFDIASSLFPAGVQAVGTYVSADQGNAARRGVKLTIDITAITGSLTVTVQAKDPVSGKYTTILASAALAATGTTTLTVYPGIAVAANASASDVLPATWRVSAAVGGTNATATIGASLIV